MSSMDGKVALVTGASKGIGRGVAERFAQDGATVIVHYGHDGQAAKETVAAIEAAGGRAFPVQVRFGAAEAGDCVPSLFRRIDQQLTELTGGTDLHIVVNNAGIIGRPGPVEQVTAAEFDEVFAVNAKIPFLIAQESLRRLGAGGRLINISSSLVRAVFPALTVYGMAKGALEVLTRSLAKYAGPRGITVNAIAPGVTEGGGQVAWMQGNEAAMQAIRDITALDRIGRVPDVAEVVAFVASEQARWLTGQVIQVSGGESL